MSHKQTDDSANSDNSHFEEIERLLTEGVSLDQPAVSPASPPAEASYPANQSGGDLQGAIGLYAEAAQDMATAALELSLGRHFACADYCNQAAEKAAQSVSLLRFGRSSMYDHDLRTLGATVGAPEDIQNEMAILSPFHPEAFYVNTPPEEADEVINADQAESYVKSARQVLRWARGIVLSP
jgi:HEPN domain-containing protein